MTTGTCKSLNGSRNITLDSKVRMKMFNPFTGATAGHAAHPLSRLKSQVWLGLTLGALGGKAHHEH